MKKLLTIVPFMMALLSCTTLKKNTSKAATKTDSAGKKLSVVTSVKNADSAVTGTNKESSSNKSENNYTRTTTIKEYFGDEFSFESSPSSIDTSHSLNPGILKYRETTTTEAGNTKHTIVQRRENEQKKIVHSIDSSQQNQYESYKVNKTTSTKVTNKNSHKVLPGILLLILFLFIVLLIYLIRKRLTLWQIFKQLLKL